MSMDNKYPFPDYFDRKPIYSGTRTHSQYVSMEDGTRLAVDIHLPKNLPAGTRLPTILIQTRYWRAIRPRAPMSWFIKDLNDLTPAFREIKPFFTQHGYAIVNVDVRGTGASFGVWRFPWDPVTIHDASELLDWIIAQPWSDGNVAGIGVSYTGTTAELLMATRHPAVKAVICMYNHPDSFVDISFPGGIFNERFIRDWSEMDEYQDRNQFHPLLGRMARFMSSGVRPVDNDRALLLEAIRSHQDNGATYTLVRKVTFRDEENLEGGTSADAVAVHNYRQAIIESQVPIYGLASWLDAGTAAAALRRFLSYPNAKHVIIGAWNHGGVQQASPYLPQRAPLSPSSLIQWREMLRFLDAYLKDVDNGIHTEQTVSFYTLGAEQWQTSSEWPPAYVSAERWYFREDQSLSLVPPEDELGEDSYNVDFEASTGLYNRWWELSVAVNKTVEYSNRVEQTPRLLTYLTPPFEHDVELTGSPLLSLQVACNLSDCIFIAYLEDIAPDGKIYYLTEGELRAIHRKISTSSPPYTPLGPYHSFKKADALALVPGEPAEITFDLLPVSALLRAGHRLRLSLAGHDQGTFMRIPSQGTAEWQVFRNATLASWIELPMK